MSSKFPSKVFAKISIWLGAALLSMALIPMVVSQAYTSLVTSPSVIDPTAVSGLRQPFVVNALGVSTQATLFSPQNWFEPIDLSKSEPVNVVQFFTVSIPRLAMLDIPVEINGGDLKKNAIHFSGSAFPGSFGNTVIFGHSALPQFYQPSNPLTVFNPILRVKIGDDIVVQYDGVIYNYRVKQTQEVRPSQIEVLGQRYDRRELTLVTCTPLGTYWNRFVVHAELTTDKASL